MNINPQEALSKPGGAQTSSSSKNHPSRDVEWIDYAKGIGITLVVYGHIVRGLVGAGLVPGDGIYRAIDQAIYAFHMPLFFLLSGLFYSGSRQKHGAGGLLASKIDTIIYPYVFWSIAQGTLEVAMSGSTNNSTTMSDVLSLIWHPRAQFWFLYALFVMFAISTATYTKSKLRGLAAPLAAACLYLAQGVYEFDYPLRYICENYIFFAIGVSCPTLIQFFGGRKSRTYLFLLLLTVAAQAMGYYTLGIPSGAPTWYTLLSALAGIGAVSAISALMAQHGFHWIKIIGSASMSIYLMHVIAGSGARVVLARLLDVHNPAVHIFLGVFAGIALPLLTEKTMKATGITFPIKIPERLSLVRAIRNRN